MTSNVVNSLHSSPKVLVVDDDSKNLVALESVLETASYQLIKAQTGGAALLALMTGDFAAIVLDVQMPDMSGIELARIIKARRRTQHIPIIFLTAHYREDEHAVLGYDAGAVDYLTKPINPNVLRSKVNVFVDLFTKNRALAEMNRTAIEAEEALRVANIKLAARNEALVREAEERERRIQAESARAEAEQANAAKDRFLAMLSHELRTPLSPIVNAVALLEQVDCPPAAREYIDTIRRNVQLEARLIDDLLDLARVRNGKLHLELQSMDLHQTIRQAIEICRPAIVQRNIQLVENLSASTKPMQGDPARIQQVFWNLLVNAAKFTPEGGTITLSTEGPDDDGCISASVSDTGQGIPEDNLASIFEAFEQVSAAPSPGLGLGLAISKALIERHGGRIRAHSEGPNRGTTFSLLLPCPESDPATKPSADIDSAPVSGLRILLVEDHHDTLTTLELLFRRRGYTVRTANSGAAAIRISKEFVFDVVVSDIGLPDTRGTDLLAQIKANCTQPIRAIAISGFGTSADRDRSSRAGFDKHLTKPVEFRSLHMAIVQLMNSSPRS